MLLTPNGRFELNKKVCVTIHSSDSISYDMFSRYASASPPTMKTYGNQVGAYAQVRSCNRVAYQHRIVIPAIIGLQSFFPLKGVDAAGVGGIEVPINERKRLAAL